MVLLHKIQYIPYIQCMLIKPHTHCITYDQWPLGMPQITDRVICQSSGSGLGPERAIPKQIPALHPSRVKQVDFLEFTPDSFEGPQTVEERADLLRLIVADLDWLLRLPHDLFWCQAVFDSSLHILLDCGY